MSFAYIVHPNKLVQIRECYKLTKKIPDRLLIKLAPFLPTIQIGTICLAGGAAGDVFLCPLLPVHFEKLSQTKLLKKIEACLLMVKKSEVEIIGLDGRFADFHEEGLLETTAGSLVVTTGFKVRNYALFKLVRAAAEKKGLAWDQARIVLAGAHGLEGEAWMRILAEGSKALTLLQPCDRMIQESAEEIIYDTGLALAATSNVYTAFSRADIIFLHHLQPQPDWNKLQLKEGTIVCSILPGQYAKECNSAFFGMQYIDNCCIMSFPGMTWSGKLDFPRELSPALAETLLIVLGYLKGDFHSGKRLTYTQFQEVARAASKIGLEARPKS